MQAVPSAGSETSLGGAIGAALGDLNAFLRQAGLYLVIVILAAGGGFMFQNLMAVDQWWAYAGIADYQTTLTVSSGRPVFALVSALALRAYPLHPFDTVLFYATMTVFIFVVFRRWTASPWLRLLILSLFISSPLLVEHMHFTVNQLPLSLAFVLLSFWFLTIAPAGPEGMKGRWHALPLGALAGGVAIATRNELVFLMCGVALIEAIRARLQDGRGLFASLWPMVLSLLLAGAVGVGIIFAALAITGASLTRAGNIGTDGLVSSPQDSIGLLLRYLDYWKMFLFQSHYLFPGVVKALVWVMAAAALLQSLFARDVARVAALVAGGLLLSALPLALGLVSRNFPFHYAAVWPLALVPCFVAAVALTVPLGNAAGRWVAGVAGAMVVVISAAALSSAQVHLANLNRRDVSTMTQFLATIRASGVINWKIALLGSYDSGDTPRWVRSREMCSAFQCTQALGPLLSLTLLERDPTQRIFTLTDNEKAMFKADLETLPVGSATLLRLDRERFVVVLK
ncbi:hypothetical protein DK847_02905 [Aestuariivirga litoralis]|uniref:Uncharacterized protein n=1 Tax=Aestuariivirga litoralis TaxID=2650924 RepID=A0A2W2BER8_9HYPH|nr:glucosyltransferase domain-containing protein [Aestuariivirga litoralis]PZF78764.1 hypothetical protein DK847_02905 [Aestuariivirga litoralis]